MKNPLKNLVKYFTLSGKKEYKIGRTKQYGISISDEETTIPKNESMIIDVNEVEENFIGIQYRVGTRVERIDAVEYDEPWNWHDCEFRITKEDPLHKKINDQEEEKKSDTSNASELKENSKNPATSSAKEILEKESLIKPTAENFKSNEKIIAIKEETFYSRNKRQVDFQIRVEEKKKLEIQSKKLKKTEDVFKKTEDVILFFSLIVLMFFSFRQMKMRKLFLVKV